MEIFKQFLVNHLEKMLVLVIMLGVTVIVYFIPYKLPFLNVFYIPILLCALYLGARPAVLGALFTCLVVIIFALMVPSYFINPTDSVGVWASIISWSSFLILTAAIVGKNNQKLQEKMIEAINVRAELSGNKTQLDETIKALSEFEKNLDDRVASRTQALEESAKLIEAHKDRVEEALHSTMDPAVVKLMIANKLRTENRRISVQFCDLKGFTAYAEEKSAEVVLTELNKYLAEMEAILLQYYAHIDKYMGDGIMAEFGAPNSFAKHALLSVACGWKMQQSMKSNNFPWKLRVGIATGLSTIGIVGSKRQAYTAFGDTVNLASRIEDLCEAGFVTVDETTYLECKDFFNFRQLSFSPLNQKQSEEHIIAINDSLTQLEDNPNDINLIIRLSDLFLQTNDTEHALVHLEKAVKIDPSNDKIKVAYANASIKNSAQKDMHVRGRKKPIHVFELTSLKDPLADGSRIAQSRYQGVIETINAIVSFPEDLTLPIECLDGSVGFARMVGVISYLLAEIMELDSADKKDILEAGYLASIGKTIVPENILNRPGQLTDDETNLVHMYPRESVRKLRNMGYENKNILNIIENHHEAMNGTGYPAGLSGEDIPIGSRVLAVAEGYVSLTSNRPYRGAWEVHVAYQELQKYAKQGKFDSQVMVALGTIIDEL